MNRGRIVAASIAVIALIVVAWQLLGSDGSSKKDADSVGATKNAQPVRMRGDDQAAPPKPVRGSGDTADIKRARIEEPEMAGDFPIHSRPYVATDPAFS